MLTQRHTQLGEDPVSVHTVEHVLAAVAGAGSTIWRSTSTRPSRRSWTAAPQPFVDALTSAGIVEHPGEVKFLTLRSPIVLRDGESTYEVTPAPDLELNVSIEFPHASIGKQQACYRVTRDSFVKELAAARTFGFMHEVEALRSMGLIQGASLDNAVVLDENGVIGERPACAGPTSSCGTRRWTALEISRLAGARVRARITASRPSHRGTVRLVRAMKEAIAKETNGDRDRRDHEGPAAPLSIPAGGSVLEIEDGKRIVGVKNVTINEPFFQGHFPGHPIMPGVLIIEAMAQVGGMLLMGAVPDPENKVVYFTSLNNVKWRRPVKPGDQLRFELELLQVRGMMCKMSGVAKVDGQVVCEADMGAVVRDK